MFGPMPYGLPTVVTIPTSFSQYVIIGTDLQEYNGSGIATGAINEYGLDSNILYRQDDSTHFLPQPPTNGIFPYGAVSAAAYSPDNSYLAVGMSFALPAFFIFKADAGVLTLLDSYDNYVGTFPAGEGSRVPSLAWNNDGTKIAFATNVSPWIVIYSRSGDIFTKLSNPGTLPAVTDAIGLNSVAWTPSGSHLACSYWSSGNGGLRFYSVSGTTFTSLTVPTARYDSAGLSWSPDGIYLAVPLLSVTSGTTYLRVYKRSTNTLTLLTMPAVPGSPCYKSKWSPDNQFLVITTSDTSHVWIYSHSGDTFTRITSIDVLPDSASITREISWSSDSLLLYIGVTIDTVDIYDNPITIGRIFMYSVSSTVFTKLATQSEITYQYEWYDVPVITSIATMN